MEAAQSLGTVLAQNGITVVYGGAHVGLMGHLADAALAAGGRVVGVMPHHLTERELAHPGLHELHRVADMHERKSTMASLADGFVALPGGFGTFEELFEIITWAQLGLHQKPCAVLNVANYFDALLEFLDHACEQGFVSAEHRRLLRVATDPSRLVDLLR